MRRPMIQVFVRLVWATWDRQPLLDPEPRRVAYRTIQGVCQELQCRVMALGGTADHVHLLVRLCATMCVADQVKRVKGASSRYVEESLGCGRDAFKWQGSYGALSVSPHDLERVKAYIGRQEEHHSTDDLDTLFEETVEYFDAPDGGTPAEMEGTAW